VHKVGKQDYHYIRMHGQQNIEICGLNWCNETLHTFTHSDACTSCDNIQYIV